MIKATLIDHMGDDLTPAAAAWVSTGKSREDKTEADAIALIERLGREGHDSCFEHLVATFSIEAPIYIMRHIQRHRLGSFNELSGRYKSLGDATCYVPELAMEDAQQAILAHFEASLDLYKRLRTMGEPKEVARVVLPLNTMTRIRWTGNLRYFANFIRLRKTEEAQYEVRLVAGQVLEALRELWPHSVKAIMRGKV